MFLIRVIFFALGLSLGIWWVVAHQHARVTPTPGNIVGALRGAPLERDRDCGKSPQFHFRCGSFANDPYEDVKWISIKIAQSTIPE
jgi:hypothetical protein